ncbi:MAG: hypothetical protein CMO01_29980 [Thalassobius sp.]|nr:hypothetical protein [Thalassovita sp.]
MTNFFINLLETSICTSILYFLYISFFRNLTHFQWNRFYLTGILLIGLIIPLVDLPVTEGGKLLEIDMDLAHYFPEEEHFSDIWVHSQENVIPQQNDKSFSIWQLVIFAYLIGFLFSLLKLLIAFAQIYQLIKENPKEKKEGYVHVKVLKNIAPCSFGKWVFLSEHLENKQAILQHELAHIRDRHTADVILLEVYAVFFWFNPVTYFIKKSINQIHEFIADNNTADLDKRTYAELILQQSVSKSSNLHLVNSFAFLPIKKRILMLSKEKSSALSKIRFVLIVPVVFLLISAFSSSFTPQNTLTPEVVSVVTTFVPEVKEEITFDVPITSKESAISSRYGMRMNPIQKKEQFHRGIDFKAPKGTEIYAAAGGTIILAELSDKLYGNQIKIRHSDGTITGYSHMNDLDVKKGDTVKKGEKIGTVGNTGLSTGPHLHFEIIQNGKSVNPEDLIPALKK